MPKDLGEIAETYLNKPVRVQVSPPGKAADKIEQAVHFVSQGDKATLLQEYLNRHPGELALVFNRTKHGAEKLAKLLDSWGFSVGSIHGNKSQGQRERTLAAFRAGETKVLVATDVAARGLDIPLVAHVYNFDLPNVPENYIHRIGRTARAGREGRAVAFCSPAEMADLKAIEALTRTAIEVIGGAPWSAAMADAARAKAKAETAQNRGGGRPQGIRASDRAPQKPGGKPAVSAKGGPAKPAGAKPAAAKPAKPRVHPAYAEAMGGERPKGRRPAPRRRDGSTLAGWAILPILKAQILPFHLGRDLRGRAGPDRRAALQDHAGIRNRHQFRQRLVHDQHRHALGFQPGDGRPDFLPDHRGQPLGRLVQHQKPGVGHQRAADGQHLLLAA
jgi:ATP-dependent RNA helicase RhlE